MSSISITDLSVTFADGTVGLDHVDIDVHPEEFMVLVGPSGSGKTTLLRTIAGFITPSEGSLTIAGEDMTRVPPENRRMGMVFQQHAVWPHMSVDKNVAYPLKRAGVGRAQISTRVQRALSLVGLDGFGNRKPASLSGGQRQRVALARAVVADPTVLLLDEALSALDEPLRDSLRRELVALTRREGLTTVHVTHDRAEAIAIADRIVVLDNGRVQQVSTPAELINAPASAAVASFIGDATLLPATIAGEFVECSVLGTAWRRDTVREMATLYPGDAATIAVTPLTVTVVPPATPGAIDAVITSVLFEITSHSITAETPGGQRFRAHVTGTVPAIGERIGLKISEPLVYPA